MLFDIDVEARARMRERARDAEELRLAALGKGSRQGARRPLAGYAWRLRQAAGFGLVRTGLRLLDPGRVWS
jgi:hypothetical protein